MLQGCSFSILGDSYSTFKGYIPEGYDYYYPNTKNVDDVLTVEDTWWGKLIKQHRMRLLVNDSYSGSTVCTHVRDIHPNSVSFVERVHNSYWDARMTVPDYIFVFGCTNDSWLEREIGQVQYDGWSEKSLKCVLPAYCYVLDYISACYKKSKIVSIVNTELHADIAKGMVLASEHYGAQIVQLHDIDKKHGHPSALGMEQITNQICELLVANLRR